MSDILARKLSAIQILVTGLIALGSIIAAMGLVVLSLIPVLGNSVDKIEEMGRIALFVGGGGLVIIITAMVMGMYLSYFIKDSKKSGK